MGTAVRHRARIGTLPMLLAGACLSASDTPQPDAGSASRCDAALDCPDGAGSSLPACVDPRDDPGWYCEGADLLFPGALPLYPGVLFRDRDGDGYGDCSQPINACEAPAEGFADHAGDCDDDDPTRPAPEQWYDGVDSDCDGSEEPVGCDAPPHPETLAQRTPGEGVDLVVVRHAHCGCCEGCDVSVQIANVGTRSSPRDVRVDVLPAGTASRDAEIDPRVTLFRFAQALRPGEVSESLTMHIGLGHNEQAAGYDIVVDPLDEIAETDESNNEVHDDGAGILVCF